MIQRDQPYYAPQKAKRAAGPIAPSSFSQSFEKGGVIIDYTIHSVSGANGKDPGLIAGSNAMVTFKVQDARTHQPLSGLHPNAWISRRLMEHLPNDAECRDRISTFLRGLLSVRPDVDLNQYLLLTLNGDNTITFINPEVSFSVTKLESIVELPGSGADWVLSKDKNFLFVTMPKASSVAVVDTVTRRLVSTVSTGKDTQPRRIALQPDGRYVWVGLDDSASVAAIDTKTGKLAATVEAGAGLHNITFTGDSRFVYVTNSKANTVSAIDTATLKKVADIPVGQTPLPLAYSKASRFVYVAALNGAEVSVIDPLRQQVISTVPLERGVVALRFEPAGRYAFAVNQIRSRVTVIDSATHQKIGSLDVVEGADQVTFTKGYAYIRGTETENFSLIELNEVKKGKWDSAKIQAGRQASNVNPNEIGVADMIVPTPSGNSVMIANNPDMRVYYYSEGMLATMGALDNYKRRPHGILILDRSMSEVQPGVYQSAIQLRGAGLYDVPLLIDQPRVVHCFDLSVRGNAAFEAGYTGTSLTIEAQFNNARFKPGVPELLRFKITDSLTSKPAVGLRDVEALAFQPPGIWQMRTQAKEVGDGIYEMTQVFPRTGYFEVLVSVASRGVRFADSPTARVGVVNDEHAANQSNQPIHAEGENRK